MHKIQLNDIWSSTVKWYSVQAHNFETVLPNRDKHVLSTEGRIKFMSKREYDGRFRLRNTHDILAVSMETCLWKSLIRVREWIKDVNAPMISIQHIHSVVRYFANWLEKYQQNLQRFKKWLTQTINNKYWTAEMNKNFWTNSTNRCT